MSKELEKKKVELKKEVEVAADAGLPSSAVVAEEGAKDKKIVKQAPVNELLFRKGDELKLKDLPFKVVEVKGLELILKRQDIR